MGLKNYDVAFHDRGVPQGDGQYLLFALELTVLQNFCNPVCAGAEFQTEAAGLLRDAGLRAVHAVADCSRFLSGSSSTCRTAF